MDSVPTPIESPRSIIRKALEFHFPDDDGPELKTLRIVMAAIDVTHALEKAGYVIVKEH